MPKRKPTKTQVKKSNKAQHVDDHSFLIISGGGFVIIALIMLMIGMKPFAMNKIKQVVQPAESAEKKAQTVTIKDNTFAPETLTVKVGSTVTWVNSDTVTHSAVADDTTFDTKVLAPGESGTYTFTKAGTYTYHCGIHPNMTGTIVVEE